MKNYNDFKPGCKRTKCENFIENPHSLGCSLISEKTNIIKKHEFLCMQVNCYNPEPRSLSYFIEIPKNVKFAIVFSDIPSWRQLSSSLMNDSRDENSYISRLGVKCEVGERTESNE